MEIQIYQPWVHALLLVDSEVPVVERRACANPGTASCGPSAAVKGGALRRLSEDDTAACDIGNTWCSPVAAPGPAASATSATVPACMGAPGGAVMAAEATANRQSVDTHAAALLAPLRLAPAAFWSPMVHHADGTAADAAQATSRLATNAAASCEHTSAMEQREQQHLSAAALESAESCSAPVCAAPAPPPLPEPMVAAAATAAEEEEEEQDEVPESDLLEAEPSSSWEQPQSWCGEDSELECEPEPGQQEEGEDEAAAREAESSDEDGFFFSQYKNAAYDDLQQQQQQQQQQQDGRLLQAAMQPSAFAAYGGPFAPPTPCSSVHVMMRDNDLFDPHLASSACDAFSCSAAGAAAEVAGSGGGADAAELANEPAAPEKQLPPQLPRAESFAPATPALSACPSLARADSSLLTAAAAGGASAPSAPSALSRSASLRSPGARAALARRALWLVCAEEDSDVAEAAEEVVPGDAAERRLAASVEAALRENPLFSCDALRLPAAASAAADGAALESSAASLALKYDNPCFAAECAKGDDGERPQEQAMTASNSFCEPPDAPCMPSLASPDTPRSPAPAAPAAIATQSFAPSAAGRRAVSCARGGSRAATGAPPPQAKPAWRPNGTKAGAVPQRAPARPGSTATPSWGRPAAGRSTTHGTLPPGAPRYLAPTAAFLASVRNAAPKCAQRSPLAAAAKATAAAAPAAPARPPFRPASKYSKAAVDKAAQHCAAAPCSIGSRRTGTSSQPPASTASSRSRTSSGACGAGAAPANMLLPGFMRPTAAFLAATAAGGVASCPMSLRASSSGAGSSPATPEALRNGGMVGSAYKAMKRPVWR
ncbi:hypothetical protein HYH02_011593 [Chlamydomonas schloesseri]|uniref:Uncharacterized protein n=1 Tax=Chlamydomonas schloesseri TaxID=2026947 RepID=A0A835T2Z6_9CHLO|nr:hypothetical protein HYH02_011593 [Chlamydomonas schloesseri]|eukprot:KAG2436082.1 hypothetical protein HYH02_011593 [Chlamydomonas schloesseri]